MKKTALTFVELIVIITILAILWVASFFYIQGYTKDTRDAKRLTDITSLYKKITLENINWIPIQDFQIFSHTWNVTIAWNTGAVVYYGTIDFTKLNESAESFKPPRDDEIYEYAYSEWIYTEWEKKGSYEFLQLRAKSEVKEWEYIVVWNYYKLQSFDNVDLFLGETVSLPPATIYNDCILNEQTINSWDTITAYQTLTVPYWNSCDNVKETRTCDNWILSWSYTFTTCNVNEADN
jgi:hypothetical protein